MSTKRKRIGSICVAGLLLFGAGAGVADEVVYDAFPTGSGNEAGHYNAGATVISSHNRAAVATGGSWSGAWAGSTSLKADSAGLSFGSLKTSGGSLLKTGKGINFRPFKRTPKDEAVYFSFLINFSDFGTSGKAVVGLNTAGLHANQRTTGCTVDRHGQMQAMVYGGVAKGICKLRVDTTYLVVVRLRFNVNLNHNERTDIWINPAPGGSVGASDLARSGNRMAGDYDTVDRLVIHGTSDYNGAYRIDEVRIGAAWKDVVVSDPVMQESAERSVEFECTQSAPATYEVQELDWNSYPTSLRHVVLCKGILHAAQEGQAADISYEIRRPDGTLVRDFSKRKMLESGDNSILLLWNPMTFPERLSANGLHTVDVSISVDGEIVYEKKQTVELTGVADLVAKMKDYPRSPLGDHIELSRYKAGRFFTASCYAVNKWGCTFDKYQLLNAVKTGVDCVDLRFWHADFEREQGEYDWSLMDQGVAWCEELGLPVIISTITSTYVVPWQRTDEFQAKTDGAAQPAGGMTGPSYASEHFRKAHYDMAEAVMRRYRDRKIVVGWHFAQTMNDNAYGPLHDIPYWDLDNENITPYISDYSDHFKTAFQAYLAGKYSINELNARYGTAYPSFTDVPLPRPDWGCEMDRRAVWQDFQNCKNAVYVDFITRLYAKMRAIDSDRLIYDWGLQVGATDPILKAMHDYDVVYNLSIFGLDKVEHRFQAYLARRAGVPCIPETYGWVDGVVSEELQDSILWQMLSVGCPGYLAMHGQFGQGVYGGYFEQWKNLYNEIRDVAPVQADVGILGSYATQYAGVKTFLAGYYPRGEFGSGKGLQRAMAHSGYASEWFSDASDLEDLPYRLIIDNNSAVLSPEIISRLKQYVTNGGVLCVFADSGNYLPVETSGESGFVLLDALGFPSEQLIRTGTARDISQAETGWENVIGIQVRDCLSVTGDLPEAFTVRASYADAKPAVVEWTLGKGEVCLILGVFAWQEDSAQKLLQALCDRASLSEGVSMLEGTKVRRVLCRKGDDYLLALYSDYPESQEVTLKVAVPGGSENLFDMVEKQSIDAVSSTPEDLTFSLPLESGKLHIIKINRRGDSGLLFKMK